MSNDYYEHPEVFIPGDLARAEDVENEFKRVQSGFGLLPQPRPDGLGFLVPFYVADATEDNHAANWGQLKGLEELAQAHADAAETAKGGAETAQGLAEDARDAAQTSAGEAATSAGEAANSLTSAQGQAANAQASATLASQWAVKIDAPVSGSDYGAKYYSNLSKNWASGSGEIEPGLKSAKGYAEEAAAIVAGARTYVGLWDASGGTYPIATPTAGDEGKYWVISVAGTLPLGAVDVGWELSINDALAYEAANLLPGNLVTQVNGKTGPNVNLDESDIPSIASTYLAAANYTAADVLAKVKTVDGAGSGLDADTLDGFHAAYFLPSSTYTAADVLNKLKTVDGAGSGLDADTLDGQQASAFFPASGISAFGASLVDDTSASAARNTLGLGTAATQNTGTTAGTIPIRDGSGNIPGNVTGNAATANRLAVARQISLTGDATGSANFDGSGNVALNVSVADNSHAHNSLATWGNYTAPFNNANNTPRAFYAAGLCEAFVRGTDGWPVGNGKVLNIPSYTSTQDGGAMQILTPYQAGQTTNNNFLWRVGLYNNSGWTGWKSALDKDFADSLYLGVSANAASATKLANARTLSITGDGSGSTTFDGTANRSINLNLIASSILSKLLTVDGFGSGLDADLLDGYQGFDYLKKSEFNPTNSPTLVWSGSSTGVTMSALSNGGTGLYRMKSSNIAYPVSVFVANVGGFWQGTGTSHHVASGGNVIIRTARCNFSQFQLVTTNVDAASESFDTITDIWKV